MAIIRRFSVRTEVSLLPEISNSLGAHLAAKLQGSGSDELTLTDEFCDMICIWAGTGVPRRMRIAPAPKMPIVLDLQKVSPQIEVVMGADLELVIRSPLGAKRLLAQAKVLDPERLRLRCDSTEGWEKLRGQLSKCRKDAGLLAYLLLYVPEAELNGSRYAFGTWEQRLGGSGSGADSRFGATFIAVNDLLNKDDTWRSTPPLTYKGGGRFHPGGVSFTSLLLQLLSCSVGDWGPVVSSLRYIEQDDTQERPFRLMDVTVGGIEETTWAEILVPYFSAILAQLREIGDFDIG
jgi:hypothetical protein